MPGTVYVFNCYSEPITSLTVNGGSAGNVPGWSTVAATKYTPAGLPVKRTKYPSPGCFAIDRNEVRVPWDSCTGVATVLVPSPASGLASLDDDLVLFVALNQIVLQTTRGQVIQTFPVQVGD